MHVHHRGMLTLCRITQDETPLPPKVDGDDEEKDEGLLENYPWIDGPIRVDTGYNVKYV